MKNLWSPWKSSLGRGFDVCIRSSEAKVGFASPSVMQTSKLVRLSCFTYQTPFIVWEGYGLNRFWPLCCHGDSFKIWHMLTKCPLHNCIHFDITAAQFTASEFLWHKVGIPQLPSFLTTCIRFANKFQGWTKGLIWLQFLSSVLFGMAILIFRSVLPWFLLQCHGTNFKVVDM